ncbi:MAG: type transport system permease protein [Gaiellales bacterium]|jgi:ABC-2 type transport system permease protein|nr:type transport system permease protein [Gaiellales bacterium]
MNLGRIAATTVAQLRMMFRRRITLFWSLVFPIILMTLLGLLFGRTIDAGTITVIDDAHTPASTAMVRALSATKGLTIKLDQTDVARAQKQVRNGDREALLVLRGGAGSSTRAQLYYSNASATQAGILKGIVSGAASRISVAATGSAPAIGYSQQSVDSSALDYIDFLLPGILALSIMISAVIGLSTVLVAWRKRGVLRRLKLTPMPLWEFLVSRIAASLALAMLQVVVLIAFGAFAFGIHISTTAWAAIPIALAGALCFLVMGFTVGSLVSEPETADAVTNVITNPMMFLSGTFIPVSAMPHVVQTIAKVLPLYYMANGLRDTVVRNQGLVHVLPDLGVLLAVTGVLAVVSLRTFRWE